MTDKDDSEQCALDVSSELSHCQDSVRRPLADDRVVVAVLGAAFGIKGQIKVRSFCEPPENLFAYSDLKVELKGKEQVFSFGQFQAHGKGFIAFIDGVSDRNAVELYRGAEILVGSSQLPALAAGDYYWRDLTGLTVKDSEGNLLGVLSSWLETGSNDVMAVTATKNSIDKKRRLIPYLYGDVVKKVDLDAKEIQVDWDKDF